MAIGKILADVLKDKDVSVSELARQVGVSQSTIASIIDRDNSGIKITLLNDICKFLEVSPELFFDDFSKREPLDDFFTTAEKNLIKKYRTLDPISQKAVRTLIDVEGERKSDEIAVIRLPKSMLRASAGTGLLLGDEYTEWVDVPETPTAKQANLVVEVAGDSMEPRFSDGDNVLVRLVPCVDVGEIGIFSVDGQAYIKKKGVSSLISVNPKYADIQITEFSDVRCFGKVIGKTEIV